MFTCIIEHGLFYIQTETETMPKTNIKYNKGDMVTCTFDHPVCEIKKDLHEGEMFDINEHFLFMESQNIPKASTPIDCCQCWCGHDYIRLGWPDEKRIVLHIDGGWK